MAERETEQNLVPKYTGVLSEERETFDRNKEFLFQRYPDRFVLIKGSHIVGVKSNIDDALKEGATHFGLTGFLVRQIREQEPDYLPNIDLGLISISML